MSPLKSYVCIFLQVLSPHAVPADDAGLSRLLIILGVLKPVFQRGDVSEELLERQVSPQTPSEPTHNSWIKPASV